MELSPISVSSSRISSGVTLFSASFSNWNKQNQFTYGSRSSRVYRFPPSSRTLYYRRSRRNLVIFANFSRPTRRSNSLRKKLIDEQQVNQNHILVNSNSDFQSAEHISNDSESSNRIDVGSGPIYTVLEDSNGKVERVSINGDEILVRSKVERRDSEELTESNHKISAAKIVAREMESGKNVIPRSSSVAKFVVQCDESGFLKAVQGVSLRPEVFTKFSGIGVIVLCSYFVLFSLKKLFTLKQKVEYSEFEKEIMRRKNKSMKEEGLVENGKVEVIQVRAEPHELSFEKPKLDKQELMRAIAKEKSKTSKSELALEESTGILNANFADMGNKIQEISDMASNAQKIEGREDLLFQSNGNKLLSVNGKLLNKDEVTEGIDDAVCFQSDVSEDNLTQDKHVFNHVECGLFHNVDHVENKNSLISGSSTLNVEMPHNGNGTTLDVKDCKSSLRSMDAMPSDSNCDTHELRRDPGQRKLKVIRTVKEAREYLSEKRGKQKPDEKIQVRSAQDFVAAPTVPSDEGFKSETSKGADSKSKLYVPSFLNGASDFSPIDDNVDSSLNDKNSFSVKDDHSKSSVDGDTADGTQNIHISLNYEHNDSDPETMPYEQKKNWMEDNFNEVEPVVKKIGVGFRDNFMLAREKSAQEYDANFTLEQLQNDSGNDEALEWMEDDNLREIVFKVRDNELANRDPFDSMDAEDKLTFYKGLEKEVERENEKLLKLHEWLHSNIENLDYGADGISLYDPPEKVIPRWKGPLFEKTPEFFNDFLEQRKAIFPGKAGMPSDLNKNEQNCSLKSIESNHDDNMTASENSDPKMAIRNQEVKDSKTVIEGSDGSIRPGKKLGKEFWQHTKKWSRGFLESYNAETDPEVKSVMKDMGKDLDRWITEKEVEEAADLMSKMPERNKEFLEKKLNKLKREMEMFGPHAVVSKYREYAEEREEDYLWWLDLPHVLCIELYTMHDGEQRIGFYSLEMAADLELEPKPCHVIAFEDAGDCKNFCYIIQAHMEMLGTGSAFIVARPPKDAFREAKANGFGVTVIRKGELQLNVDQTLEEVEEQITEIGSKIYHDKIMEDRSVDISSLMKGVFGLSNKPSKRRRTKRKLKKLRKNDS